MTGSVRELRTLLSSGVACRRTAVTCGHSQYYVLPPIQSELHAKRGTGSSRPQRTRMLTKYSLDIFQYFLAACLPACLRLFRSETFGPVCCIDVSVLRLLRC